VVVKSLYIAFLIQKEQFALVSKSMHQWRSEAKCLPGPTIKVPRFPPVVKFDKNLKLKKILIRTFLKKQGLLKHLEDHAQTLTN